MTPWKNIFHSLTNKHHNRKSPSTYNELKIEPLEVRTLLAADLLAANAVSGDTYETIASASSTGSDDTATVIQSLIESGAIAAAPAAGLPTPGDYQGNPLQPIVTDNFSQAVPSNDWWSSVHFAEYGDQFSAPLFIHPLTVKPSEAGLSISAQTIQSAFETGPTLREYQVAFVPDLHLDLFGSESATQFALDSYSDWAFTGKWNGTSDSPSATMAQGSPFVWIEGADLSDARIRWEDGSGTLSIDGDTATFTVAGRSYGLYAPEGNAWQRDGQSVILSHAGEGSIAIALLPSDDAATGDTFRQAARHPITDTQFSFSRGEDPYSLRLNYDYLLEGGNNASKTVLALYPHLARLVPSVDPLTTNTYASARGSMAAIETSSVQANVAARGVLPALPSTLDDVQLETLRQLLIMDEAATNPAGYFSRFSDPYWSGKSLLKLMQFSQVAELVGETAIRDNIHQAVKEGLGDWFHFNGNSNDRHFAYNAEWDTLQAYPDAFYSGQMLNDHHFHMGYLIHSAALLGMSDPAWAAENRAIIDLIIKDVAGTDTSDTNLPRLRNFSPMAGHSWASGHGAFTRGNNHESSSEAMNFATSLMLWGEVSGQADTTLLGQTLYSLEAEAIAEYWFDKYGTTYPEAFDVESVGMVWGDGAAHATWFSAEVEMIKAINFLPFHGGSLYLSEMARDGEAVIDEITELNGGAPDVWQSLISQYEALVNPVEAWDNFSLNGDQPEEGQSPAFTYYWMATLANLGTPTSAIRGDHPLSAVFQNGETNTYTAHNAGSETLTVTFNDGVTFNVAPGSTQTTTRSAGEPVDPPVSDPVDPPADPDPAPPVDPPAAPDPGVAPPALEDLEDGRTLMLIGQTFQEEYTDFIAGTGLTPAGSSHYATFYLGQIEQGDDSPNAEFLDYVRDNDLGDYAMVALSFKDNTPAGGYGQMINPNADDYDSNAIWEALNDIRGGAWDVQIDSFAQTMASRPETQFLLRIGYEVSLFLFAYTGEEYVVDWLNDQASAGINVFENPDASAELDRSAFIDAYNHIADRIESQASNVEFGYHPVRGYNDTQWLYPGGENVDWVGFSVFNNDVGMEVNGTINAPDERIDPNLALSMDFAQMQGHEIVIAESTAQNPAASNPDLFIEYLDRLDDVVEQYDVAALTYINSDWPAHGWGPEWGDSRVEVDPTVEAFFLETFGEGTRYVYADRWDDPVDPPTDPVDPPADPPTDPVDPPADPPAEDPVGSVQILDNGDAGFTQTGFTYMNNQYSANALNGDVHHVRLGSGVATWTFTDLEPGDYHVATTWQGKYDNRYNAVDVPFTLLDGTGSVLATTTINQNNAPSEFEDAGLHWESVATVSLSHGTLVVKLTEASDPNLYSVADAVRIERIASDPAPPADPPADPPVTDPPVTDPVDPPTDPPTDPVAPVDPPTDPPAEDPVGSVQILDNGDAGFTQTGFSYMNNQYSANALNGDVHHVRLGSGVATWTFTDLEPGDYHVATTWQGKYDNRYNAVDVPFTLLDGTGSVLATTTINQNNAPSEFEDAGLHWESVATVSLSHGTLVVKLTEASDPNLYSVADAVRIERIASDPVPPADPPADPPVTDPVDPPADPPYDPPVDPPPYEPPVEEVTYGFGLLEPGGPDAYATTGFDQGEFVSNINFSHRATADPLVDPGNPNFWHAHDFFVNPSTDAYSTVESLMAVDGSSALPANNESVYWAPSMINQTTGEYVTPLDSSIAYYRIARPFDPGKLEVMPTGLSVIAGAAMPTGRQSIGVVAWNYIGASERYDHLPIGDEWQDLPLQALIYFPTFWDGENLDSANHKSHMAYADAAGGPSTHPYLLPQLELQIHYGRVPQDAQLVLTSDSMTQDHPDYAPGWSLHADHIHLPWPEYDDDGNLYDGFERRVSDSMRFPIFAGTDGNAVRTIPTGATQPFTPEPFTTYPVFPGQDNADLPDTTAPILVTASPTDGSVDVPVNTEFVLVFDEDVVAGEGMIHLMTGPLDDPLTTPVESHTSVEMFAASDPRVQIDGNRVRVALQSTLETDTTYHLDIGSSGDAFLDLAGNGYQRDHADYSFTTTDGVGVDFTIAWPGSDTWMGIGNTSTIYGQVNNVADVDTMRATIQNLETGLYQRTDGTFGAAEAFEITVNTYDGHWFFLHTPAAGGTYRVEVFATDKSVNVTSRSTTFNVHGDPPGAPADPPVEDPPVSDPPADEPTLDLVAATTDTSLLVDPETGLAYVQDVEGDPLMIRRSDDYWNGDVPLSRDGSTLQAAARDELGRLRVLDVGEWGAFAWVLDESGMFSGEEGPNDSSVAAKETLFQFDLNGDGVIGQTEETTPPVTPPADPDPGGDLVAEGVQVRLMTFNVYYASLGAAERIDGIAQAIADYMPDVASIQEMWGEKDQILAAIEAKTGLDYALSVGSNTWDGDILYRADRWRILEDGVISYDGSRGMSYATLEHLSTGAKMSVYGMHPLSGVSEDVHLRNMEMATAHMAASAYAGEAPVVLLGDMNAHENSDSMRLLRDGSINAYGQDWTAAVTFEDTFRVANGDGANGDTGFGVKIDYVYVEERVDPAFRVESASIRNDAPGGSDHFPVMAEVVLLSANP